MNNSNNCIFYRVDTNKEDNDICNDNDINNKLINKIVSLDFYVKNELTNVEKIKQILNYKKYFYTFENSQILNITDTTHFVSSNKKNNQILLTFKPIKLTNFKSYLKCLSTPTKYVFAIIDTYRRLLSSIALLVEAHVVHNYINFSSIVIDAKNECPIIQNFAFSLDISSIQKIKPFFLEYDPTYLEWPIEFHIISYMKTNKLSSLSNTNIVHVVSNVIQNNDILQTFGSVLVSSYKEEALIFFNKYVNRSFEDILSDMLLYYDTWDNYALSILYLRVLIGIHKTITFNDNNIKNKFIILFMKLLVSNIHFNPSKRVSLKLTTNKFNELLDSLAPKDYIEVIDKLV